MEPSSLTISESKQSGSAPTICDKATPASVWPPRAANPPLSAIKGKTWPGRMKSEATADVSARALTVLERSLALTPVVIPGL